MQACRQACKANAGETYTAATPGRADRLPGSSFQSRGDQSSMQGTASLHNRMQCLAAQSSNAASGAQGWQQAGRHARSPRDCRGAGEPGLLLLLYLHPVHGRLVLPLFSQPPGPSPAAP